MASGWRVLWLHNAGAALKSPRLSACSEPLRGCPVENRETMCVIVLSFSPDITLARGSRA